MSDKEWSGKTGGTRGMQRSLIRIFRWINPMAVYPIVWVWICFYILFGRTERRGMWQYWHEIRGQKRWRAAINLYLTYLEFGKVILDRFAAYSGRKIHVCIDGEDHIQQLLAQTDGFLVFGSHLGNQELAGYTFSMPKPMYVLIYLGDTETVIENRRQLFEKRGIHIIPMVKDGSHVLEMHNVLAEGNILSIHGDRLFHHSKTLCAPMLGHPAQFPLGPFRMAVAEEKPVVAMCMMRDKADTYTLYFRPLVNRLPKDASRQEKIEDLLTRYVATLEDILDKYPRQWFNFYPFWT